MMEVTRERRAGHGLELCVHRFRDDAAAPCGLTALLLHGFLDGGATWDRVAAPLCAAGIEVLAPDQRGFGASERAPRGGYYHFPDYVADVDALVRGLAPSKLVVVGHSMGGTVACNFAGARPERVAGLVLLEGVGPPGTPPDAGLRRTRQWLADLENPPREKTLASLDDARRRLAFYNPRAPEDLLRARAEQLTTRSGDGLAWAYDPLHRTTSPMPFNVEGFKEFLRAVRCPVLFMGGGEDGFHPPDEAERLAAFAGEVTRVDLAGAGHALHWTRPDEVSRAILDFCRRIA